MIYEMFQRLRGKHLKCAMVGGVAVEVLVNPPSTVDLDILVNTDGETALRRLRELLQSLRDEKWDSMPLFFGRAWPGKPSSGVWFIHPQTCIKVDLLFTGSDKFLTRAVNRAPAFTIKGCRGVLPNIMVVEDLVVMKMLAGREKDTEDVEAIMRAYKGTLDTDYIEKAYIDLDEGYYQ